MDGRIEWYMEVDTPIGAFVCGYDMTEVLLGELREPGHVATLKMLQLRRITARHLEHAGLDTSPAWVEPIRERYTGQFALDPLRPARRLP
mgnify:CR=1 FL=1